MLSLRPMTPRWRLVPWLAAGVAPAVAITCDRRGYECEDASVSVPNKPPVQRLDLGYVFAIGIVTSGGRVPIAVDARTTRGIINLNGPHDPIERLNRTAAVVVQVFLK